MVRGLAWLCLVAAAAGKSVSKSGLQVEVTKAAQCKDSQKAESGDKVTVHYGGFLQDGENNKPRLILLQAHSDVTYWTLLDPSAAAVSLLWSRSSRVWCLFSCFPINFFLLSFFIWCHFSFLHNYLLPATRCPPHLV